jgi:hypothetical protein
MMLVGVAMVMLMAPAGYHRRVEPNMASRRFVSLASRLLAWTLIPLMIAICAEFFLVASIITGRWLPGLLLTLALLGIFIDLWIVLPWRDARRQHVPHKRDVS